VFTAKRVLFLLLAFSLVLSACAAPTPQPGPVLGEEPAAPPPVEEAPPPAQTEPVAPPPPAAAERTIIVALSEAPLILDPADHRNRPTETVLRNMFDGLVTRDTTSGTHLELATGLNWVDELTLEVQIREGVKFHDGTDMTADDVVFTFERIINENMIEYPEPHTSPRKGLIAQLASIEKTGDYSVVMHFSDPWPVAEQMLVHQQIVPKAYLEEVGTQGFLERPIGTGPFRFVSTAVGLEEVVMERFADYYGGAPTLAPVGAACVDRVIIKVIP
jgi:peptide/nickel transport system substrate-binding protein